MKKSKAHTHDRAILLRIRYDNHHRKKLRCYACMFTQTLGADLNALPPRLDHNVEVSECEEKKKRDRGREREWKRTVGDYLCERVHYVRK